MKLKNMPFSDYIIQMMKEEKMNIMDVIVHIHESQNIELDRLASLVKSSPKLKGMLLEEASNLNMLKKAST